MPLLINFSAFQIGWFSSVLGAAKGMPWIGPLVFLAVLGIHVWQSRRPVLEVGLVLACGVIGVFFDSFLVAIGWVAYPSGQFHALLAPYWIVTMWMLFGTTLNLSLTWLKGRPLLAIVVGAIAGPTTYLAGQKLGGMLFVDSTAAIVALAIGWGLAMPVLMRLAEELDGVSQLPPVAGQVA